MSTQPTSTVIRIVNPSLDDHNSTFLTGDASAAATTITTLDNTGFTLTGSSDYYILLMNYGEEKSEIRLVDASDAATDIDSFKIDALSFDHSASEPVTFIPYNQVQIFGATTSGGTKNLITTIDIDVSQQFTSYTYEGTTYSYFYAAYYNSNDDEISAYTEEITSSSFTRNSAKRIIKAATRKAFTSIDESQDSELNWDSALDILNDGIEEVLARKRKWSFYHTIRSGLDTTTASQEYITKPSDISRLQFIIINNIKLSWISQLDYDRYTKSGTVVISGSPSFYTEKNNQYYLYPTPDTSYDVIFEYWKKPSEITSLTSTVDSALTVPLIYYCASQFANIRGNDKRGDKMDKKFMEALENVAIEYTGPWQEGDAEYVEFTNTANMEDEYNSYFL